MKYQQRKVGDLKIIEFPGDPAKGTILLLHGFGATAQDLASLSEVYQGPTWIFPEGPLEIPFSPAYTGRAWFHVDIPRLSQAIRDDRLDEMSKAFPPELDAARISIERLILDLNIPRSQLILGGFSQGAVLAVETALKSMERCRGLLLFSGTLINELNWKKYAPHHATTPFFQSHGTRDSILPLSKAEELAHLLTESGLKGKLHVFQGIHTIPPSILAQLPHFLAHIT